MRHKKKKKNVAGGQQGAEFAHFLEKSTQIHPETPNPTSHSIIWPQERWKMGSGGVAKGGGALGSREARGAPAGARLHPERPCNQRRSSTTD